MVATSLPLSKPSGTVRTSPCRPSMATRSMLGVAAASMGVLPPSSRKGSSAAPSGMMMAYFMRVASAIAELLRLVDHPQAHRRRHDRRQRVDRLQRRTHGALQRPVRCDHHRDERRSVVAVACFLALGLQYRRQADAVLAEDLRHLAHNA